MSPLLDLKLDHLQAMTDKVGIFQHATRSAPNPDFGYCTDDNARALMFVTQAAAYSPGERRLELLSGLYFRFVQAAFDAASGSFRNLLGHDNKWVAEDGPGDAAGRTLWALGSIVGAPANGPQRSAAKVMFERALPSLEASQDLRPVSCAILGMCAYLQREQSRSVRAALASVANRLTDLLDATESPDWPWPEAMLTYENARLPHAMLAAGRTLEDPTLIQEGLRMLRWLMVVQTRDDLFAPIGNHGWYARGRVASRFDQQPIEADATIAACAEAFRADGQAVWLANAQRAFDWYLGDNTIGQQVCVPLTGGCRDGLSPTGVNQNQGAESTLAWLTSQVNLHALTTVAFQRPTIAGVN